MPVVLPKSTTPSPRCGSRELTLSLLAVIHSSLAGSSRLSHLLRVMPSRSCMQTVEFTDEGGLVSYGNDAVDAYRRAGVYVGRILNGAIPSNLPVDQATKFEFVINRKTANAQSLARAEGVTWLVTAQHHVLGDLVRALDHLSGILGEFRAGECSESTIYVYGWFGVVVIGLCLLACSTAGAARRDVTCCAVIKSPSHTRPRAHS